jgi:SAM-dependent methyltransferase
MTDAWWTGFFDDEYLRLWGGFIPPERSEREADALWRTLGLAAGHRVLDAPCGYGRLSRVLATRGADVLGVDFSLPMIDAAEAARGTLSADRLRYAKHDLREPLPATLAAAPFDVALNVFSSLGYGTEAEDLAILSTLRTAVRPGGRVFIETAHRDAMVATLAAGGPKPTRFPDGTILMEEPHFDPIAGRVDTSWFWSGPHGSGQKDASLRMYTATELVALMARAGLRFLSAHAGCTPEPFVADPPRMGPRLGLLAERPT